MIKSRITSKSQTTIPQAVRVALRLHEGDEVAYQIEGDRVVISKARAESGVEDPFAIFKEWASDADRKGYADF